MQILKPENNQYVEIKQSLALPKVTAEKLPEFLPNSDTPSRWEWINEVINRAKMSKIIPSQLIV